MASLHSLATANCFMERCWYPPGNSSQSIDVMLQFNGGELVFQVRQTARPIEGETVSGRACGFGRRGVS